MSLTIRAYNVLFGDCLLISWDESDGESKRCKDPVFSKFSYSR